MDKVQLQKLVDSKEWKVYEEGIRKEVRAWRAIADQPDANFPNDARLYLYSKAQGLEEALNLIEQWLAAKE